jgi:hypothetical protein
VASYNCVMGQWQPTFLVSAPLFAPLTVRGARLATAQWPALPVLQSALDAFGVVGGGGRPLRVVAPDNRRPRTLEDRYEARIFLKGELVVRECNWHDLFNVLVWLAFPQAKAGINARHFRAMGEKRQQDESNRGPTRDTLTLFDEGGVIVACSDPELLGMLRAFAWKQLFWCERQRVIERMRCLLFGHALYEMALAPFVGITGRAALFEVAPAFHALTQAEQMRELDARLAALIAACPAGGRPIASRRFMTTLATSGRAMRAGLRRCAP